MARMTRSERRARRQAQDASGAGRPPRRPVAHGSGDGGGDAQPHAQPHADRERKGGVLNFIRESYDELKKVEWPGQSQLIQGVAVVLIACVIVGIYLFAADQVFKRFVQNVLLGQ